MRWPCAVVVSFGFFVPTVVVPERFRPVPVARFAAQADGAWAHGGHASGGTPIRTGFEVSGRRGPGAGAALGSGNRFAAVALGLTSVAVLAVAVKERSDSCNGENNPRPRIPAHTEASHGVVVPIRDLEDFMAVTHSGEGDELKVVKFVTNNCKACAAMRPKFDALVRKHGRKVRFYEVNLAHGRSIFAAEGVRKTPLVLYYRGKVGRVGGFAFGPPRSSGLVLSKEFSVVNAAKADFGALSASALVPALRFSALVGMLRALVEARARLEEEALARSAPLTGASEKGTLARVRREAAAAAAAARAEKQPERAAAAAALFAWVDGGSKGAVDGADLERVMEALTGVPSGVSSGRHERPDFSTGLPKRREEMEAKVADALDLLGTDGCIPVEAFTNLILLHAAHERANVMKPEAEAKAAFALLDAGGNGAVPFAEAATTIAGMCALMPLGSAVLDGETDAEAIEKMLRTFDFEDKGHLHFECFARIVMRSSPSPW